MTTKEAREIAAIVELERRKSWASVLYFIMTYVRIEDPLSAGGVSAFQLWEGQQKVLATFCAARLAIVLKARQLGLTWLALAYSVWRVLKDPLITVVVLSKTDDDAMELIRRLGFILDRLPIWMVQKAKEVPAGWTGPVWEKTAHQITVYHPDPESGQRKLECRIVARPASEDAGRSFTANVVLLDEWAFQQFAREIWVSAYPTINRPGATVESGQVIGISTGQLGTLFEEIWHGAEAGENGFTPVFLPWWTDPRRDEAWFEATKRALPNTWRSEYPVTSADAFSAGEGAFFPEWDPRVHDMGVWEPPVWWRRVGAFDAGYSTRAAFQLYALSPDGWAVGYRELYMHQVPDPEQARQINALLDEEMGKGCPWPDYIVADPAAWQRRSQTGESTAEIFGRAGLPLRRGDNNLANGWRRVHQWLAPFEGADGEQWAMLRYTDACPHTLRTFPGCRQKKTNPEDIAESTESHLADTSRYFCMSRPHPPTGTLGIMPGGFPERARRRAEDDDDDDDEREGPTFYGR